MPVYNGARYLRQAVESVLSQTVRELELVVVDDGSRDNSREIVEGFARSDPRVRLISRDGNEGVTSALNEGWRQAAAPYIARLDSDDVALPARLARQLEYLEAQSSVAAVGGAVIWLDGDGRRLATKRFATSDRGIRATLETQSPLAHPAALLRRTALEAVGGYRLDQAEDYDLWLRLSERWRLANLAVPVTLYRLHPAQISVQTLERQTWGRLAVQVAARDRRSGRPDPLDGVAVIERTVLDELRIDPDEVAAAVEADRLHWAALMAAIGYQETARELLEGCSPDPRLASAFEAATELNRADLRLSSREPLAAAWHILRATQHAPRYTSARVVRRLKSRIP
jgi:hypothetical protein